MKRILLIVLAAVAVVVSGLASDVKIIDRSAKTTPEWLLGSPKGCLIVTVRAKSLPEAQILAQNEITERVIKAVATNVSLTEKSVSSETATNAGVDSRDEYSKSATLRAANMPFLKGISLSKAADIYWVKVQDKKTKEEYYEYSVQYPFTRLEQEKMSAEFEKLDTEHAQELASLEAGVGDVATYDGIKNAIAQLEALAEFFVDGPRLSRVSSAIKQYEGLYSAITILCRSVAPGKIKCALILNGHKLDYYTVPKVSANCASSIQVTPSNGEFVITFNTDDCLDDEENYLTVTFRINGRKLEHRFILRPETEGATGAFSVVPTGRIYLTADTVDVEARSIAGVDVRISLDNRNGGTFAIRGMELSIPGVKTPLVFENMDAVYTTKGVIQVKARAEGVLSLDEKKSSAANFVTGRIMIVDRSGPSIVWVRLSLPYTANWE